ncbi:Uncharacterised protein [Serratia marcescens]|nr:Uncharacterised protein [Serratia marcescens]
MGKAKLTGLDKQIVEMRGSLGLNLKKSLTELFEDDSD